MAVHRNRNLAITLLFSLVVLLALAHPSSADAVSPDVPHRRDHVNLNRMIKRRAPPALIPRQRVADRPQAQAGAVGAAADPSASPAVPSSAPAVSAPPASQAPGSSQPAQPISSPVPSVLSSATPSVSSTPSQSSASPTSSSTPTSTTSSLTPSTSSPPSTSSTPTPSSQANKQLPASKGQSASVDSVTLTSHAPAPSSSGSDNSQIGGSRLSRSAITILIVIAASIGGCVVIWTIIRKWKFRPSAQFEDRLEPVDWLPAEHDSGLPTHRRGPSNASSFHSAGHDNMMGLSQSDSGAGYNAGRNLTPIPDHDFTAGAAAAPVGGYADLARGPSPQPPMQEALQRGPSFNHGYENYHGGNGVQEAYDHSNLGARY